MCTPICKEAQQIKVQFEWDLHCTCIMATWVGEGCNRGTGKAMICVQQEKQTGQLKWERGGGGGGGIYACLGIIVLGT